MANKKEMQAALDKLNALVEQLADAGVSEDVQEQLERAGAALEQEINKAAKLWYVFDKHDCFGAYEKAYDASEEAERMAGEGGEGVHVLHLTVEEKDAYYRQGVRALIGVIGN